MPLNPVFGPHFNSSVRPAATSFTLDNHSAAAEPPPTIGIILIGGALVGAQVRDIRLANELVRRGYPVRVWWAMDRAKDRRLDPAIEQRWLFQSARFGRLIRSPAFCESIGRFVCNYTPDGLRSKLLQRFPAFFHTQLKDAVHRVCDGVEHDRPLIQRFARELTATGVTHLLPTLEFLAPFAEAARPLVGHKVRYLVTFQGYELYANYAREIGREDELYQRLRDTVAASDWPAIGVSPAYCRRIHQDVGVPMDSLSAIPPGVPAVRKLLRARALELVRQQFPEYRPEIPLIGYVGRRDSEKGLDLLLYAAKLLKGRGIDFQLAICGPTAFGGDYSRVCRVIAENLRCQVLWSDYVSDELRTALFQLSHVVAHPSIHEEPFGMAPVEALACGTPAVVSDSGGVAGAIEAGDLVGGLQFRSWDTRHLADQLQEILLNPQLREELSAAGPGVAEYYSVERMGDRILRHLGLPATYAEGEWNKVNQFVLPGKIARAA